MPSDLNLNPLSNSDLQRIDATLNQLTQWPQLYTKMECLGMDCSEYRKANELYTEWLQEVKRQFFPETVPGYIKGKKK